MVPRAADGPRPKTAKKALARAGCQLGKVTKRWTQGTLVVARR
jgi:hypothetical protein